MAKFLTDDAKIVALFNQCLKRGATNAAPYRALAKVNEQFVYGDGEAGIRRQQGAASNPWFFDDGTARITVPLMDGLAHTWASLLNSERRSAAAAPASSEPDDIFTSELANKLLSFFILEEDTATKTSDMVTRAFVDGTSGMKIMYDKKKDKVTWSTLSIGDYAIDPSAHRWRDAQWVVFENWYSQDAIDMMWEEAGCDGDPPQERAYVNSSGDTLYGVCGHELWLRPTRAKGDFPKGLFATVINGVVVEKMAYPYVVGDDSAKPEYLLPFVLMKARNRDKSAYGSTPCTGVVGLQRAVNEMVKRQMALIRKTSNPQLVVPNEIAEGLDLDEVSVIRFSAHDPLVVAAAQDIRWVQPAQTVPEIAAARDYYASMMAAVVGINDIVSGNETRSLSGRAFEGLVALDKSKNADAAKSLDDAVLAAAYLTLCLIQLYYTDERTALLGDGDVAEALVFKGSDLQGVNLRLEASSEIDKRSDVIAGATAERAQAGLATPLDLKKATNDVGVATARKRIKATIASFLSGDEIDTADLVDFPADVFTDELDRAQSKAFSAGNRKAYVGLHRFAALVREGFADDDGAPDAPPPPQDPGDMPAQDLA